MNNKIANIIDHTILKATTTKEDVVKICNEAKEYGFFSVCINPANIELAKEELKGRENILLLGDGLPDLKMISEEQNKNAITVGFLEEKIDENLKYFNEGFDIVLTNQGTLNDVNKILNLYNF